MAETADPETVDELLKMLREIVQDERSRGQGLDTKTSTLTGFTGATLAIVAGLGRNLEEVTLGAVGDPLFRALFVAAVLLLTAAAVIGLAGVLRPQPLLALAPGELQQFGQFPLLAAGRITVQGQMLNTLIEALLHERALNDRKARLTRWTALALAAGYTCVAAGALTVALFGSS
jgi:hypothetical protein